MLLFRINFNLESLGGTLAAIICDTISLLQNVGHDGAYMPCLKVKEICPVFDITGVPKSNPTNLRKLTFGCKTND